MLFQPKWINWQFRIDFLLNQVSNYSIFFAELFVFLRRIFIKCFFFVKCSAKFLLQVKFLKEIEKNYLKKNFEK